ncbi:hypothetical protein Tco_0026830 [Tanacetum coccineum]
MVDWWADPKRMEKFEKNAQNRAKNKVTTHQGSKSFAQGRNEYLVDNGYYEDLIESWRRFHSKMASLKTSNPRPFISRMIPEEFGPDYVTRAHVTKMMRRSNEEKEMLKKEAPEAKKQCLEASQRLAGLEAFMG